MIAKKKGRLSLCIALILCNLLFIWGNSLLPASISGGLSQWLRDLLGMALGEAAGQSDGVLRKLAHVTEFACLGVLLRWLYAMLKKRKQSFLLPAAWGCIAACIDEMLQHFAPGRAPRLTDVAIDSVGVLAGIALFGLGNAIKKKK